MHVLESNLKPRHIMGWFEQGNAMRSGYRADHVFEPVFKVEDRAQDPDFRIAKRSWWPVVEVRKSEEEEGR